MSPLFRSTVVLLLIACAFVAEGCKSISDITNSLSSLSKLEFKLKSIERMKLAGVELSKISEPSRLSITDGISLGKAFAQGSLPASFVLNVDAHNPNDGTSGKRSAALTLNKFDWRLLIDDVRTVGGDLDRPIDIPGTSANTTIPLAVNVDLYQFFKDRGYDGILNLALALGGVNGSTSRVKLDAQPSVGTPFGQMTYPGRLTIVDSEFRSK
jgi:hypothetical protein